MSGWDEMFPTISACAYPGPGRTWVTLPDHGEVWALPWRLVEAESGRLTLAVEGQALPYRLTRTLAFTAPDTLALHYQLVNLGAMPLPYIWAAHPQFACGAGGRNHLPARGHRSLQCAAGGLGLGRAGNPLRLAAGAVDMLGNRAWLNRVGPATLRRGAQVLRAADERIGLGRLCAGRNRRLAASGLGCRAAAPISASGWTKAR